MRAMILGTTLLALAGHAMAQASPTPAAPAVPTERELREACSWDPAGMRECLQKKLRESEVDLKEAEATLRGAIEKWDIEPRYARLTTQRLAEASARFIQFRTAQCSFTASLGGTAIGNALEAQRAACAAELNARRAESLKAAAAELPAR